MNSSAFNEKIYRYKVLQTAVSNFGQSYNKISPEQQVKAEQIALKQLELESRLLASPEARHLTIPAGRTTAAIDEIISRYNSKDEFNQELEGNQLDIATLHQSVKRELIVEAVMDLVASQVEVSQTDARLYYYFHLEKFERAETRSVRHILLTINPHFPENTREQALARISLIARRLKKNPKRFAEQAMKHSECPTSMEGGFLGQIPQGTLFTELDKVVFELPVGAVSDAIESPLGFHLMLCDAIYPAGRVAVDEVVGTIAEKLTLRKKKKHQQQWLRALLRSSHRTEQSDSIEVNFQPEILARA